MTGPAVLALDLATATGWALAPAGCALVWPRDAAAAARDGSPPGLASGVLRLPSGEQAWRRFLDFEEWLTTMQRSHRPTDIFAEAPLPGAQRGWQAARLAWGLMGVLGAAAARFAWRLDTVHNATVRKHFTGSGASGSTKDRTEAECRRRGWRFADDNEADALAILDFGIARLRANRRLPC